MDLNNIRITLDPDYPDKVELEILDENGAGVEGGQFDLNAFVVWVLAFYDANY